MKHFMQSRKYKIIQYSLLFILGIALAVSFLLCKNPINVSAKSEDISPLTAYIILFT